jgi:hypothetical protein
MSGTIENSDAPSKPGDPTPGKQEWSTPEIHELHFAQAVLRGEGGLTANALQRLHGTGAGVGFYIDWDESRPRLPVFWQLGGRPREAGPDDEKRVMDKLDAWAREFFRDVGRLPDNGEAEEYCSRLPEPLPAPTRIKVDIVPSRLQALKLEIAKTGRC